MLAYDQSFVQSLQNCNEIAFAKLYQDTFDMFYRYIKWHYSVPENDIQDILADTYVKIWNNLKNIDDSKSLLPYLRTILKNTTKDHFKNVIKKETAFSEFNHEEEYEAFEDGIQDEESIKELFDIQFESEIIIEAMDNLDDKFKDVIFLKYIEWYENSQIAEQLSINEENVRQRLSRWLAKLRLELTKKL